MEAQYPKYLLYGLLIVGSWLLSCLLHFQFFHLSLLPYPSSSSSRRGATLVVLPIALDARFLPPTDVADDGARRRRLSSCEGRYVYMMDVPPRFDVLSGCVEGSPAFDDEYSVCVLMSNAGLGPVLAPAADNGSDGDSGIIPSIGW